jgi:uncharacterized protein (TIGR02271 family)
LSDYTLDALAQAQGAPVYDSTGERIGSVEEVFYDDSTGRPEWIGIGTGFLRTKRVLVPLDGASMRDDGVYVPYDREFVKDAPDIDSDEISGSTERELYSYYRLGGGRTAPTTAADQAITRSEEELEVGKREVEGGSVRLRKWVETEPVSVDVTLHRETARVVREPINQTVDSAQIGEAEVEVRLRAEVPMVRKETVAKERIGLEKNVEAETRTVTDEVRKERVEVDGE